MTNGINQTLSEPICYVVIDPDSADSGIGNHKHNLGAECATGQRVSALEVRFSLAEATPAGGCASTFDAAGYAQLRLAIDVIDDLHGYPQLLPHAVAAQWGLVALTGPRGPFNRVATELLHRLGADLETRVYGPLVLHAVPDRQQHIGSLSDLQLRHLTEVSLQIGRAIDGGNSERMSDRPLTPLPTVVKENLAPWSQPGHTSLAPNQRSRAVAAG